MESPTIRKRAENLKPKDLIKLTRADGIRWFEIVRTKFSNSKESMVTIEMVDNPCAPEDRVPPWTVETAWDARFDVISPDGFADGPELLPYPPVEASTVILPPAPCDVPEVPEEGPAEAPSASEGDLEDSIRTICADFSEQLLAIVKNHRR